MGMTKKLQGSRIVAFCMVLTCLFILLFPQTAHAAPGDTVNLAVQQTFAKPASSSVSGTFGYVLTRQNTGAPMPAGSSGSTYTFNMTNTDTAGIPTINYTAAGTYTYTLEPDTAPLGTGFTRAAQKYTIEVYVTGSASALDVVTLVKNENSDKVSSIEFKPSYQPLRTGATADLPVVKTVNGSPPSAASFSFVLRAMSPSSPMPSGSSGGEKWISFAGGGTGYFGTWQYTAAGTYNYTVTEANTGVAGYAYDGTVYSIRDTVTDVSGQLTFSRAVTSSSGGSGLSAYAFTNTYTPADPSSSTPPPAPDSSSTPTTPTTPTAPPQVTGVASSSAPSSSEPESGVESEPDEGQNIGDPETPLTDGFFGNCPYWSLLSLLMGIAGAVIAVVSVIVHFASRRKGRDGQAEDGQEAESADAGDEAQVLEPKFRKLCNILRAVSVLAGLLVGILFLYLDDLSCPMVFVNKNTILIGITFIVQLVLLLVQTIIRRKKARPEYEEKFDGIGK